MLCKILVLFLIVFQKCFGIIHHLNESEYARMPPVFHMEPYGACPGRYCVVRVRLAPAHSSDVYRTILEYSEIPEHFNHTILERGICIPQSCPCADKAGNGVVLKHTLEGCLNETMRREYGLNANVEMVHCNDPVDGVNAFDLVVAVFVIGFLLLNVVGSLRENSSGKFNADTGDFLSFFAVQRHWRALLAPRAAPARGKEGLQAMDGIRVLSMMCVCMCHVALGFARPSNSRDYEENIVYVEHLVGLSLVTQSFLVLSSFLAADQAASQASGVSPLRAVMKLLAKRLLRIMPLLMFWLAISMTWVRFLGYGPLFQYIVLDEAAACWREWPLVLFFLNNYAPGSLCKAETWYLATDLQLWIVVTLVVALCPNRARVLAGLALLGAGAIAFATYRWDLHIWVKATPELCQYAMLKDSTVNWTYKPAHTNLAAAALGALGALVVRRCEPGAERYRRYRYLVWASGFALVALLAVNAGPRGAALPAPWRALLAACFKAGFAGLLVVLLVGLALRVEDTFYRVLSWSGWVVPARLSYAAYISHLPIFQVAAGNLPVLVHFNLLTLVLSILLALVVQLIVAVLVHLLLQAPIDKLVGRYLLPHLRHDHHSKAQ